MTFSVAVLLLALRASAAEAVVARVDGVAITVGAVSRRVAASPPGVPMRPEQALDQLVSEALLAADARRTGLASSSDVAAALERSVRTAAADVFIDDVASRATIGDTLLRPSFRATADFASLDALYVATQSDAEASRQRIKAGSDLAKEAPRAVVARVNPNPAEAPPIMRGALDPALGIVFDAKPGEVVGPVETSNGWVVARLIRKELGTEAQFAARRPALEKNARAQVKAEARRHLAQQMRANEAVQLDEAFLRSLQGPAATPQQLDRVLAMVGGVPLRYRDIHPTIAAIAAAGGHAAGPGVKITIAWQRVDDLLVEASAIERGYAKSPAVEAIRPDLERAALASAAAARLEAGVPVPSDREVEAFYKRNRDGFGGRRLSEVRPIAVNAAASEKRATALSARIRELRSKASVSIDETLLATAKGSP